MSEINAGAAIEAVAFDFEYTSYLLVRTREFNCLNEN